MRLQQEGDHLQTKDSGLRRSQTCQHLDLRLPAQDGEKMKLCLLSHPVLLVVVTVALANHYTNIPSWGRVSALRL